MIAYIIIKAGMAYSSEWWQKPGHFATVVLADDKTGMIVLKIDWTPK